jgi:predicted PurR-regulated permease PerM
VSVVVIVVIGLYTATEPEVYTDGLIRLVPVEGRKRAREVLDALGSTLRWWLFGRVVSMSVVGVLTTVGLWLMAVPLALALGLVTALLTFIPNIGPVLSVVPALLLVLTQNPARALYVLLLYLGIHTLDGYLLAPLVQERTLLLPPVLTIVGQMLLGVLLGGPGVVLAAPLTAVLFVLVRMLYVEDKLGESIEGPGGY